MEAFHILTLYPQGLSKLANILFTKSLQKRFDAEGVPAIAISLHPGGVKTGRQYLPLNRIPPDYVTGGAIDYLTTNGINLDLLQGALEPIDGAITSLFAATSVEVSQEKEKYGGAYLEPFRQVVQPSEDARDEILAEQLWVTSEKAVVTAHI